MEKPRPSRDELFGFYYLGFSPEGTYKFANANHLAAYYHVSVDAVLRWLEEYDIDPATVAHQTIELSRVSVDLQLELPNLTPEGVKERIREAVKEFDAAGNGRKPWVDGPIR